MWMQATEAQANIARAKVGSVTKQNPTVNIHLFPFWETSDFPLLSFPSFFAVVGMFRCWRGLWGRRHRGSSEDRSRADASIGDTDRADCTPEDQRAAHHRQLCSSVTSSLIDLPRAVTSFVPTCCFGCACVLLLSIQLHSLHRGHACVCVSVAGKQRFPAPWSRSHLPFCGRRR